MGHCSRPMCPAAHGLLLALLVLLQLVTPATAGWSWLNHLFGGGGGQAACKPLAPQKVVDLQAYASKRWYIHQQVKAPPPQAGGVPRWVDKRIRSTAPPLAATALT